MKQWMSRILLGVLALSLSGCVASQAETKITSDGSGTNTFKVGFEEESLAMLQSMGGEEMQDPFKDVKDSTAEYPAEWGATTSDWQETINGQAFKGVKIDMKFANLATLNEQLSKFLSDSGGETNPTGQALSNLKVTDDGKTFIVTGDAVATDLAAAAAEGGSETAGMPGMEKLNQAVIVWQVTLPGEVTESGPADITTVNGNTVTWKIPADKAATYSLKAVSSKSGGGSSSLPLILGGIGLLVVLAGVAFFVLNRRKAAPVAAGYQQYGGQTYDPNAQQNYSDPNDPNRKP